MKIYPTGDDRRNVDAFTLAVAVELAQRDGHDLAKLRNFGEEPTTSPSKYEYLRKAHSFTDPFDGMGLTPLELAEIWKGVPLDNAFTPEEIDRFRQWYNQVEDVHHDYLEPADAQLAIKLHDFLGVPVSKRTRKLADPPCAHMLIFDEDDMPAHDAVATALSLVSVLTQGAREIGIGYEVVTPNVIRYVGPEAFLAQVMPDFPGWRYAKEGKLS